MTKISCFKKRKLKKGANFIKVKDLKEEVLLSFFAEWISTPRNLLHINLHAFKDKS